eukprot:gnl/TRDRNA2_/TRDRNA2_204709_c0_seq1.p1 gnl/TRDRNA2_/TRDRNA2_204709_c0~~gnl/TRDRNA2_/TRDRNA2_204709_c0_seq1.p1  ORF type:complete len:217 (-),score=30.72 gnl/TRDRNA2_/TRDRNA2_204709_c0_seq1:152-802(-)
MIDALRMAPDALQWDYQIQHNDEPKAVAAELDRNLRHTVMCLFQACYSMPAPRTWNKHISMFDQRKRFKETSGQCSFFLKPPKPDGSPSEPVERDGRMVTEDDINRYVEGLERNGGFTVPNFYYHNHKLNNEYNCRGVHNGGVLEMPTLMITAEYDTVCTPQIAANMEKAAKKLSRAHVYSGHWAQQERPREVNAALVRWIAASIPNHWPRSSSKL